MIVENDQPNPWTPQVAPEPQPLAAVEPQPPQADESEPPQADQPQPPQADGAQPMAPEPQSEPEPESELAAAALPTMDSLRAISVDLDDIDEILARLDAQPVDGPDESVNAAN